MDIIANFLRKDQTFRHHFKLPAETKENHRDGLYPLNGGGVCGVETGLELAVEVHY